MAIYQKKPVHVQAWQWTPGNKDESRAMLHRLQESKATYHISGDGHALETNSLKINVPGLGIITAPPEFWIVRVNDRHWEAWSPTDFEALYELVDAD